MALNQLGSFVERSLTLQTSDAILAATPLEKAMVTLAHFWNPIIDMGNLVTYRIAIEKTPTSCHRFLDGMLR